MHEKILSPSAVYAQIKVIGEQSAQIITLGVQQDVQWVGKECTILKYQISGPQMSSFNLLLSSYPGNAPTVITVNLLPCVVGFDYHRTLDVSVQHFLPQLEWYVIQLILLTGMESNG